MTFAKDATPPVNGFWSLSIYNEHHFFSPNAIGRFSVGTKKQDLKLDPDGSLTIYVQADPPTAIARELAACAQGGDFSLYVRAYWPRPRHDGLDAAARGERELAPSSPGFMIPPFAESAKGRCPRSGRRGHEHR